MLSQAERPADLAGLETLLAQEQGTVDRVQSELDERRLAASATGSFGAELSSARRRLSRMKTEPRSLRGHLLRAHTKCHVMLAQDDRDGARAALEAALRLWEAAPHRIAKEPQPYVATLNNIAGLLLFYGQHADTLALFETMRGVLDDRRPGTRNRLLIKEVARSYNLELEAVRHMAPDARRTDVIARVEGFLDEHRRSIPAPYHASFQFQLASLHFADRNYAAALAWANRLHASTRRHRALPTAARLLNLMIHAELQNLIPLGYFAENTKRYLKRHRLQTRWRREVIAYLQRLARSPRIDTAAAYATLGQTLWPDNAASAVPPDDINYANIRLWVARNGRAPALRKSPRTAGCRAG